MKKQRSKVIEKLLGQKQRLLGKLKVPADALPGSLSVSRFRCGKKNCHCSSDEGHENWTLTYMSEGKKKVKHIPSDLVEEVRHQVEQGKTFKDAINQIFAANAELLVLLRKREQ